MTRKYKKTITNTLNDYESIPVGMFILKLYFSDDWFLVSCMTDAPGRLTLALLEKLKHVNLKGARALP